MGRKRIHDNILERLRAGTPKEISSLQIMMIHHQLIIIYTLNHLQLISSSVAPIHLHIVQLNPPPPPIDGNVNTIAHIFLHHVDVNNDNDFLGFDDGVDNDDDYIDIDENYVDNDAPMAINSEK